MTRDRIGQRIHSIPEATRSPVLPVTVSGTSKTSQDALQTPPSRQAPSMSKNTPKTEMHPDRQYS
jgi:hypothetical protein